MTWTCWEEVCCWLVILSGFLTKSDPFAHPLFTSIIYRCSFNAFFNAVWVEHVFSSVGHAYVYNICHFDGSWHGNRCTRDLSCRGHFDVEWVPYVFLILCSRQSSFRVMKSHLILSKLNKALLITKTLGAVYFCEYLQLCLQEEQIRSQINTDKWHYVYLQ